MTSDLEHAAPSPGQLGLELAAQTAAGRYMRASRGEAAYTAFVPHPLPPAFEYDGKLTATLSAADRALGELNGLGRMLPNPNLLISPFIHREAVLSSRIEGTQATIIDVYALEAGQQGSSKPPADVREVANYVASMRYGLERLNTFPLSLRFLRELHERLMSDVRGGKLSPGDFRTSQNWIGRPGSVINDATYVPPPPAEMTEALGAFELYLHAEDERHPPLVRLALIHGQFEMIHPFVDGNGRIGRLLISLLLVHWDLLALPLLYLSAYFERDRNAYYRHLLVISREGHWAEWVRYFLKGVADESRDAAARARALQDLREAWRDRLTQARASSLSLRLVDRLFESPIITIPQAQRMLGVTYPSAKLNIEKLVAAGILEPFGRKPRGYGKAFIATDVFRTIDK